MDSTQKDANSRLKLAQLWHLSRNRSQFSRDFDTHKRIVTEILKDDIDVNCKVTIKPYLVHLQNCTALHFVYFASRDVDAFNELLDRGADFTVKNANGQTVLHLIVGRNFEDIQQVDIPFINSVLSAHVKFQNSTNPRDDNGVSHLHGACITNQVQALELFLENGASVDEAVNHDAPKFAGYAPLHFAARFNGFEAARTLLAHGANAHVKDANGWTPLDLIVEYRVKKLNFSSGLHVDPCEETSSEDLLDSEKIIRLLLEEQCLPSVDLSIFHVACTLNDLTIAESLLDRVDDVAAANASYCAKYTALHFAAINSIGAVKMLLTKGGNLETEDANGCTPFDICIDNYAIQEIHDTLRCTRTWIEIRMSDGKTSLLDLVEATTSLDRFQSFLQDKGKDLVIPADSPVWPGCTILHLAVILSTRVSKEQSYGRSNYDETIVKKCLESGLDVNARNAGNQTPVHVALRQGKTNIVRLLLVQLDRLDEVVNIVDDDNLSYLHVACAMRHEALTQKLLTRTCEVNVAYRGKGLTKSHVVPGSTPLHVTAANGTPTMAEMLLRHGADLHAIDAKGFAPIHYLLQYPYPGGVPYEYDPRTQAINGIFFDSLLENPKDVSVDGVGLNYLHVASYFGHVRAVEKLLELGSNVNAAIDYVGFGRTVNHNSLRYSTCTPLYLAKLRPVRGVVELLLRHGADVFVEVSARLSRLDGSNLFANNTVVHCFVSNLSVRDDVQKFMEEKLGLTKLHVACYLKNEEAMRSALNDDVDANARVRADSAIFAGCTPLHLLTIVSPSPVRQGPLAFAIDGMIQLLLDRGADVTIANAEGDTPVHAFLKYQRYFTDGDRCKDSLLNAQRDFAVDHEDAHGMSHFHLACHWHNVEVVEKFLQRGSVDVDRPTDCFATCYAGFTPLHFALSSSPRLDGDWTRLSRIVDLLLERGANVAAKDFYNETPLHKDVVLRSQGSSILDKLLRCGADIRSKNLRGLTFIDKWPFNREIDYASLFQKCGYQINSWNGLTGEGCIPRMFLSCNQDNLSESSGFKKLIQSSDVRAVDELGRTVIHNTVAVAVAFGLFKNYVFAIESFVRLDVDIDHQDQSGQTALHYATRTQNEPGVRALLHCGADINIVDRSGNSAFSPAAKCTKNEKDALNTDMGQRKVTASFKLHVTKLQHLKLEVSQVNRDLMSNLKPMEHDHWMFRGSLDAAEHLHNSLRPFFSQVEMAKTMNVGSNSLYLFDFLNETGVVTRYPFIPVSERTAINDFVNSNDYSELDELVGIVRLQFNKMKKRFGLIKAALTSLRTLLGFSIPGLREEITRYLTNSDLKSLIASTTLV